MKTITIILLILAIPLYIFFLAPNYKKCVESGTNKGVCIHTWLFRF